MHFMHVLLFHQQVAKMVGKSIPREQKLLHNIDLSHAVCLEIGPSYNPILPKSKGYKVVTVDHCTCEELKEKYSNIPGIDTDKIEDVDYIWQSGSLCSLIDKENYFDYAVASHLIEHIPNPIRWIKDISSMLKDGAYFAMAVLHRDFCFDFGRPVTTTGQWLQAYSENHEHHQPATIYDSSSYNTLMNKKIYAW